MPIQRVLVLFAAISLVGDFGLAEAGPDPQKHVLLLYDSRSDMLGNIVVDQAMRLTLTDEFGVNLDIRSEYFEVSALAGEDFPALQSWLQSKYAKRAFDVVVAVGSDALRFVSTYERILFRGARVAFWGTKDGLENWTSDSPLTGVLVPEMKNHLKATLDFVCTLQPDLRRLIVVSGASPVDRRWEAVARTELTKYQDRFAISYLAAPTFENLERRLATLPERSAIVFLSMNEDGAGRQLTNTEVLRKLNQSASAPVYVKSAVHLDTGVIGGALASQEALAIETARVVARILRGERIENIPIHEGALTPTVNWKQLQRWKIPENRIPPGTLVIQRDPSTWELYRWHILGVLSLCGVEGILIIALLIHRARRKRAESSLRQSKRLLQSTIDALNARIALLDGNGTVVAVNQAWLRLGEVNAYIGPDKGVGRNYLEVCESGIDYPQATLVLNAIRELMSGARDDFGCIYECTQAGEKSWFQVRMNRFYTDDKPWVVMEHENVTEIKQAHDAQQQLTGLLLRARDEERRRIARDLHDVTVQNLATIKADLTRVRKTSQNLDAKTLEKIDEGLVLSDQVIDELRTLSYLLHPPLLDELGLIPALQWFIRGFIERSGIQVQLLIEGNIPRLNADIEIALFRVAQESMTNIRRHSGSPSALISVTQDRGAVVLQITDEGCGISRTSACTNQATPNPGVGILGMGERLRQLGGYLEIESGDQGTTVTARVPAVEESYAPHSTR